MFAIIEKEATATYNHFQLRTTQGKGKAAFEWNH